MSWCTISKSSSCEDCIWSKGGDCCGHKDYPKILLDSPPKEYQSRLRNSTKHKYPFNYETYSAKEKVNRLLNEVLFDLEDTDDNSLIRRFFNDIHSIAIAADYIRELRGTQLAIKEAIHNVTEVLYDIHSETLIDVESDLESIQKDIDSINNSIKDIYSAMP
jgi:hypothetical protein